MPALDRGECRWCRALVALRKGGLTREHRAPGEARTCKGSGELARQPRAAVRNARKR